MISIFIASDHAGFEMKSQMIEYLKQKNQLVSDLGCYDKNSVDYPDFADRVCTSLQSIPKEPKAYPEVLEQAGILICGSGQGMCIRANRYSHIRAALVYNSEVAQLAREHNDANVICLGARMISSREAQQCIDVFLSTHFMMGRHLQRVQKLGSSLKT